VQQYRQLACYRYHSQGSYPYQGVAGLQQIQIALSFWTAMLNGRQQLGIVGGKPANFSASLRSFLDSLPAMARISRAFATHTWCPMSRNIRLTQGECVPHSMAIRCLASPAKRCSIPSWWFVSPFLHYFPRMVHHTVMAEPISQVDADRDAWLPSLG